MLTIITPAYNRANLLPTLYNSLQLQSNHNFEWLLVDDGSTDLTRAVFEECLLKSEPKFEVKYIYKANGGKHTALNLGIKQSYGNYILILDSDDQLTQDAVETIHCDLIKVDNNSNVAGISYLKSSLTDRRLIGDSFPKEGIFNNIKMRYHYNVKGDKCEVFKKTVLQEFPFPEFEGEKFISECIVWNRLSVKYDLLFVNKVIYMCEYLGDGLSANNKKLSLTNPQGVIAVSNEKTSDRFPIFIRIISCIQYIAYSKLLDNTFMEILRCSINPLLTFVLYPFGLLLYIKKHFENK